MRLNLDHQQRLNLIALMGMERGTVAEIRMLWGLQDRLALDESEQLAIGYRVVSVNGQEQARWDKGAAIPEREVEVSEAEGQRLRRVIEGYQGFATADRKWIVPLLDQLPDEAGPGPVPVEGLARTGS